MPRGVAVWLIDNTALTFNQIAEFCGLHRLELQAIADAEQRICSVDPVAQGELTLEEIKRCETDPDTTLILVQNEEIIQKKRSSKYVPRSKRGDRPDAIAWILKYYPSVSDDEICKLLGTTKSTISSIKEKRHWNMKNITPKDPVHLGLCTQENFNLFIKNA